MERLFQTFQYGEAGRQIYEFFWSDFADWYVEIAKEQMKNDKMKEQTVITLTCILDMSLRLLHPFTPFVTEELWGYLRKAILDSSLANIASDWPDVLIMARWPEPHELEGSDEVDINRLCVDTRDCSFDTQPRAEKSVTPSKRIAAIFAAGEKTTLLQSQRQILSSLSGLDESAIDD